MIKGNPKRSAVSSIVGYVYQFWVTLWSWINLSDSEKLYIECGEDFEIEEKDGVVSVQVKNKQSSITLNSQDVIDAINNFWELVQLNPKVTLDFKYLTTADIGTEKKSKFDGKPGLEIWKKAKSSLSDVEKLKEHLLTKSISKELNSFLTESSIEIIQSELIQRIEWITGSEELGEIKSIVEKQMVLLGENFRVPPDHSKKAIPHLLLKVINTSTLSDPNRRIIDRVHLLEEFEAQTHVTVPISSLAHENIQKEQNVYQSLSYLVDDSPDLTLESSQTDERILPKVLDGLLVRDEEIETIKQKLFTKNAVVVHGGSGIGKSTIAKFLGHSLNQESNWVWISCTSKEPKEIQVLLKRLTNEVITSNKVINIVLDDLNVDTPSIHHFKNELAILIRAQRLKNSFLLITSQKNIDSTFQSNFEVGKFKVPPITNDQIQTFLENLGCPNEKISVLSKMIEIQSKGHPQLAHALIVGKRKDNWKISSVDEIFSDTEEIQIKKQEARQLLISQLDSGQLKLIYILSLNIGSFSKDLAVLLAEEIEDIEFPGDAFDSLVGPWIDISSNNRFNVSPLLSGIAQDVWSATTINGKRNLIINKTFGLGTLDIRDASNILIQAFISNDAYNIIKVIVGLLPIINKDEWNIIATYFDWVIFIEKIKIQELFTDNSNRYLFRLFQYKIAKEVDREKAREILGVWNIENPLSLDTKGILNRIFILSSFFTDFKSDISSDLLFDLINEYEIIRKEINENKEGYDQEFVSVLNTMVQFDGFGRLIFHQINDREKFVNLLNRLEDDDYAKSLFSTLNNSSTQSRHVINSLWLDEDKKEEQDWDGIINILDSYHEYFKENDFETLQIATICAKSIVLDEYLDRSEEAFELLQSSLNSLPKNQILKDRLAAFHHLHDEHEEAINIWDELLPNWEVNTDEFDSDSIFSCRKNAISHYKLDHLEEAQKYFFEGYSRSKLLNLKEFEAGFLADAAYMAFLVKDNQTCLRYLFEAAKVLESLMPILKEDFKYFAVLKLVQSTILWINHRIKGKSIDENLVGEPIVGMSSNPHRNEGIRELPNPPFEITWELLYDIENFLDIDIGIKNKFHDKVEINKYIPIRLNEIIRRLSHYFDSGKSNEFPSLIEEVELTFAISQESRRKNESIEQETKIDEKEIKKSIDYGDLSKALILIASLSHFNRGDDLKKLLTEWKTFCSSIANGEILKTIFDKIEALFALSSYELSQILYDSSSEHWKREFAALFLLSRNDQKPEILAYASVILALHKTIFTEKFSSILSMQLEKIWLNQIEVKAVFINPKKTVPRIESACNSIANPKAKIAEIILSVLDAVSLRIPKNIVENFKSQKDQN
jgi:energy-coupling factor transporter ATP-binding protein EcfA2